MKKQPPITQHPKLFGTDGIRARADAPFFAPSSLYRFGRALGHWLKITNSSPELLIIRDTRISGPQIMHNLAAGLTREHIHIYDGSILPTPAARILLEHNPSISAALIISASHNPPHDNGLKLIMAKGKLTQEQEQTLEHIYDAIPEHDVSNRAVAAIEPFAEAFETYYRVLTQAFRPNLLQGLSIVLDCANGATHTTAPAIFKCYQAAVHTINTQSDGTTINVNCGSTSPKALANEVVKLNADFGFAFDGDGDRVIAIDAHGRILDGDSIIAIISKNRSYQEQKACVGTIMSNQGLELELGYRGKKLLRTSVGDRHIMEKLITDNLLLGGEPTGHIIMRDSPAQGDGVYAALKTLETIIDEDLWNRLDFPHFPQVSTTITILNKHNLTGHPYAAIIQQAHNLVGDGRIIVRYSGTEPVLRIMVEAQDLEVAREVLDFLATHLRAHLT